MINFSFVIPEKLAGMALPGRYNPLEHDLALLKEQGIKAVVSLTEHRLDSEILQQHQIEYLQIPIRDFTPPSLEQIEYFVEFVDMMLSLDKPVVVHCHAGIGRTGTMLASYLVKTGYSAEDAINTIRKLRPGSIETAQQEDIIWTYAACLKK